jgi:hypothetical protein
MAVYVVSREHPPVFESLGRAFAKDPDVQVLLDRRLRDRRRAEPGDGSRSRRVRERRRGTEREQLRDLGWVRIDPGARDLAPVLRLG